jgi:hypothetical protein
MGFGAITHCESTTGPESATEKALLLRIARSPLLLSRGTPISVYAEKRTGRLPVLLTGAIERSSRAGRRRSWHSVRRRACLRAPSSGFIRP